MTSSEGITQSTVVVTGEAVANQHQTTLRDIVAYGELIEQQVQHGLRSYAASRHLDLARVEGHWEYRVHAVGYEMPVEMFAGVEDDIDARAKVRERWLAAVKDAVERNSRPIMVDIADFLDGDSLR